MTAPDDGTHQTIPLRGARGMIADKMAASLRDTAQLTHHARADMSTLLAAKTTLAEADVKVSVEDLLITALVRVLGRHPEMNGVVKERDIVLSEQIDLCVAIALPGNLLAAPAIFAACGKSLSELRAARQDLVTRAKANTLTVPEMTGGSFTVSNLGLSRVEQFTPILNAPQIGILGVGRLVETAVPGEGGVVFRPFAGLSLTFDHRAVDGAPAADFLSDVCAEIESFAP